MTSITLLIVIRIRENTRHVSFCVHGFVVEQYDEKMYVSYEELDVMIRPSSWYLLSAYISLCNRES